MICVVIAERQFQCRNTINHYVSYKYLINILAYRFVNDIAQHWKAIAGAVCHPQPQTGNVIFFDTFVQYIDKITMVSVLEKQRILVGKIGPKIN